jgi:hypothetical protein
MNINRVILTKVPHVMFEFPTPTQLSQLCVINMSNVKSNIWSVALQALGQMVLACSTEGQYLF